jgi:hypothetical protein
VWEAVGGEVTRMCSPPASSLPRGHGFAGEEGWEGPWGGGEDIRLTLIVLVSLVFFHL